MRCFYFCISISRSTPFQVTLLECSFTHCRRALKVGSSETLSNIKLRDQVLDNVIRKAWGPGTCPEVPCDPTNGSRGSFGKVPEACRVG